jgi:hypothetical protein
MAGLGHLGVGLAAKRLAPRVPLVILLAASMVLDLLWGAFALTGLDSLTFSPWSHSLFMAASWSLVTGLLVQLVTRDVRASLVLSAVVLSHWVVDFVSHPMLGITNPLLPDLPLAFASDPRLGLGLYSTMPGLVVGELVLLAGGMASYLRHRASSTRSGASPDGPPRRQLVRGAGTGGPGNRPVASQLPPPYFFAGFSSPRRKRR